jgi:hypothetical protein
MPLTITFLSFGILSSSIIKFLPFSNPYFLGIDMLVSLDSPILLFQKLTSNNFAAYLNILVYCHTRILGAPKSRCKIITKCARIKSHTYDDSWYKNECHIINI